MNFTIGTTYMLLPNVLLRNITSLVTDFLKSGSYKCIFQNKDCMG